MKPKIILSSILAFLSLSCMAQVGLQLSMVKPSKTLGYIFAPAPSVEIVYKASEIDDRFKLGLSLGYFSLKPRQDTFPITAMKYDGGWTILPGYETWSRFNTIYFTVQTDLKIFDKAFSPVIGLDIFTLLNSYSYSSYAATIISSSYSGGSTSMGINPRIGASYEMKDTWLCTASVGKSLAIDKDLGGFSFWKTSIGFVYYFD